MYAVEDQWSSVLDRGGVVDFFGSRFDVPQQRRFGDLASVRRYVEAVLALPGVVAAFPGTPTVAVRERAGQAKAHYEPGAGTIAVPLRATWAARESVMLHEVAHHVAFTAGTEADAAPGRPAWHGPHYRRTMCELVAIVMGDPAAFLLRAGYESAGLLVGVRP